MTRLSRFPAMQRLLAGAALVVFVQACGGDDPQVPTTFKASGQAAILLNGVVATDVPVAPQVQILDAKGKGIAGLRVRWRIGAGSGGGVANDSTVTDAAGVALSGGWTLGTVAGTQTLTATADGVSPVTFTAQAAPGPAAGFTRLSAATQQATVNTNVPQPPSVRAEDFFGNVVPGVPVTFAVASGGGTMEGGAQVTNANGVATAGGWKLGTGVGQHIANASASGVGQASFSATAVAGAAANLVKVAGDNQESIIGLATPVSPGVRVVDEFGNPVGSITVTFTPGPNSGSVTGGTVLSDAATGIAFVGSWVLGGAATTQTLVATSSSTPGKSVSFAAMAVTNAYRIEVRFIGEGGTPQIRQAFVDAAAKWRRIIVGRTHTVPISAPAGACTPWTPAINETITDLVIYARIGPIDGSGMIVGQAGFCAYVTSNVLPLVGAMEFDEADVAAMVNNGTFTNVVLHEMGHVLGVGTMWNERRTLLSNPGSAAPFFTGQAARAAFSAINTVTFSGDPVPVEGNARPVGTRDSHWRESVFGNELMQGFVKQTMPLSRVTAASLADLGFVVNLSAADPFSITSPILQGFPQTQVSPSVPLIDEAYWPIIAVDPSGRIVSVTPRRRP